MYFLSDSQFMGVFIISTTDHGFGLSVLISTVRKTKNYSSEVRYGIMKASLGPMKWFIFTQINLHDTSSLGS